MKFEFPVLAASPAAIETAMLVEGCRHCAGCPHATQIAREIVYQSGIITSAVEVLSKNPDTVSDYVHGIGQTARVRDSQLKSELQRLGKNCPGYSDKAPINNPSALCQSPASPDSTLVLAKGRLFDIMRLRFRQSR